MSDGAMCMSRGTDECVRELPNKNVFSWSTVELLISDNKMRFFSLVPVDCASISWVIFECICSLSHFSTAITRCSYHMALFRQKAKPYQLFFSVMILPYAKKSTKLYCEVIFACLRDCLQIWCSAQSLQPLYDEAPNLDTWNPRNVV